jgi:hypothetical protein
MRAIALSVLALLALPAAATGRPAQEADDRLWATVNVCDSPAYPNRLGVRGSMPGLKRRSLMEMRFQAQYRDAGGEWHAIRNGADSDWRRVGRRRGGSVESGWTFEFLAPRGGGEHVLRGLVRFRWTIAGTVVRRAHEVTEGGHRSAMGGDPAGFSAAECRIS